MTADNDPAPAPFGAFAPNAAQAAIIRLAQGSRLKRGAFRPMLSRLVNLMRAGPVDVEYQGVPFRFHHQGSATERGALFNPDYNREELDFLRAHAPPGGVFVDVGGKDDHSFNDVAWRACDTFRGVVDAENYRNYILVMLFWKYMSDVWRDHRDAYLKEYNGDAERVHRFRGKLDRECSGLGAGAHRRDDERARALDRKHGQLADADDERQASARRDRGRRDADRRHLAHGLGLRPCRAGGHGEDESEQGMADARHDDDSFLRGVRQT
mgnify:CR=1 FL=1